MPAEGPLMMEHSFAPLVAESLEFKRISGAGFKRFKQNNSELESTDSVAYWKKRCLSTEKEFSAFKAGLETILSSAAERHADKTDGSAHQKIATFETQLAEIRVNIHQLKDTFSVDKRLRDGSNHINSLKSILSSIHLTKCEMNQRHFAESNQIQEVELQAQHLEAVIIPASQPLQPNSEYPYRLVDPASQIPPSETLASQLTAAENIRLLNEIRKEILKTSVHKEPLHTSTTKTPLVQKTIPTLTRTRSPTYITRKSSLTQSHPPQPENDKDDTKLFKHLMPAIPPLKHRHSSPLIDPRRARSTG